ALNQSSHSENVRLKEIAPATFGICFLGTPHQGSKSASIGKIAYHATVAVTRRPNVRLLHALERNSDTLDSIADSFSQTLLKVGTQISSFREEMETRKFFFSTIVVDSNSAKIGDRGEEVGSILANHRNMSKFSSATDVGFKRVSAQLRRWVGKIKRAKTGSPSLTRTNGSYGFIRKTNSIFFPNTHRFHVTGPPRYVYLAILNHPVRSHLISDCLASLNNEMARTRIGDVAKSHDLTFHWLFDRDVVPFREWLESNSKEMRQMFWIQGKPGSGKSTLMKYALHEKRTREILACDNSCWTLVGFFFHDRGSSLQKSLSGMLQEILYQILVQVEDLIPFVQPHYAKLVRHQQTKSPVWDVRTLRSALEAIVEQRETYVRMCIFLDALDEHDGDNDELASLLYELISNADNDTVRVKVCLASRSWNVFEFHFGQCPGFAIHDHTQGDIQKYTISRLGDALEFGRPEVSPEQLESIAGQVTNKASGVFIWVRLVVDELVRGIRDGTPLSVLEEDISKMPQELKDLYLRTLGRIERAYVKECFVMLQMALCSLSTLPLETFVKCTSYTLRGRISEDESTSQQEMIRRLKSRSGGLLEVISTMPVEAAICSTPIRFPSTPVVQFIHQTVKEFVRDCKSDLGICWKENPVDLGECGYLYLLRCGIEINDEWVNGIGSDLFEYASLAEKELPKGSTKVCNAVFSLTAPGRTDKVKWLIGQEKYAFARYLRDADPDIRPSNDLGHTSVTALIVSRLAVMAGLRSCARLAWESWYKVWLKVDEFSGGGEIPSLLLVAALGPRIVLNQDRMGMINSLLGAGHPVDLLTTPIPTPAGSQWHPSIISRYHTTLSLLLTSRNLYPITEETRFSIARVFLEHGADPNASLWVFPFPPSPNCLHHCARFESEDMVELFLKHGADPSKPDTLGLTPRMYATLRKHPEIIRTFSYYETGDSNQAEDSSLGTFSSLVISGCVLAACVGHGKVIGEAPGIIESSSAPASVFTVSTVFSPPSTISLGGGSDGD
ncbi:hypothetical protein GP486_006266, partial [Trichoglossum hirsutum]